MFVPQLRNDASLLPSLLRRTILFAVSPLYMVNHHPTTIFPSLWTTTALTSALNSTGDNILKPRSNPTVPLNNACVLPNILSKPKTRSTILNTLFFDDQKNLPKIFFWIVDFECTEFFAKHFIERIDSLFME